MTKFETIITRIGCNICDSPKIKWSDPKDESHLCEKCLNKNSKFTWNNET